MRPLKLTIEGIKSISEKQTINFEKLSANGIFGIFGIIVQNLCGF